MVKSFTVNAATSEPPPPLIVVDGLAPTAQPAFNDMAAARQSRSPTIILSAVSREIADKVFYQLRIAGENNFDSRIAVTVAVPLADLKRETEFGRVLAEYLLTDLADRGLRVTELRLGRDLHILPQAGEFILSRNIGELANHAPNLDYVVVSTFANTRNTLMLYGRLIDLKDGLIKTSWRHTLPLNRELLGLFQPVETPKIPVRGVR